MPSRSSRRLLALSGLVCVAAVPAQRDLPADAGPVPIAARIRSATGRVDPERLMRTIETLVSFGTRHTGSATDDPARGIGAARDWIEQEMRAAAGASGGRMRVERLEFTVPSRRMGKDAQLVDLVATLPGTTDPDRVYVLSGHYDSINGNFRDFDGDAPGANDDASGTAAMLEACRVLADREFAATILFVAYDGEEMGLLGSQAHAEALAAQDRPPVVDGMVTNDIVGNTLGMDDVRRRGYVRCFSYAPRGNDSLGRGLARAAARAARSFVDGLEVKLVYRGDRYGRGGDHRPFFAQGWPAVRFTEPREDYSRQHQNVVPKEGRPYGDLPRFIDQDYLAKVCRLDVALLAELAAAPRVPTRPRAQGARDRYDTFLSFELPDDAVAVDLCWRDTTAADWQETVRVPRDQLREGRRGGLFATLEGVCLDDVVVGVASVGADGARSRVVAPPEPDGFYLSRTREGREEGGGGRRR